MHEAREEMLQSLNESNLEKMRKASKGAKQTLKMKDGSIGMDSFTASAIMQIYDKVNDKNKKTMENLLKDGKKADIVKLMKFAMSKVNAEYVPEEVELDEGKMNAAQIAKLKKVYEPMRDKRISTANANKLSAMMDKFGKDKDVLIQLFKADIPFVSQSAVTKLITKYNMKGAELNKLREEVELDEAPNYSKGSVMVDLENDDPKLMKDIKKMGIKVKDLGDSGNPGYNEYKLTGSPAALKKGGKKFGWDQQTEEVDLGEAKMSDIIKFDKRGMSTKDIAKKVGVDESEVKALLSQPKNIQKAIMSLEEVELDEKLDKEDEPTVKAVVKMLKKASGAHAGQAKDLEKAVTEEDEIDEGKMSQLHQLMKDGKSAKEIAKIMKLDVKTIQALMDEYAGQEIKTEGAAADARRAIRSDPDMKQRAFSKDDSATDDDRKAASKNIMMQMRKVQSLKGRFDVEFQDGKKTKVPTKIAMAVQQKYNSFRKPADKEKFQAQVGKSYKDMLKAVQEGFPQVVTPHPAFASGYKEKGKNKKESKLERMNNKLQENNNG